MMGPCQLTSSPSSRPAPSWGMPTPRSDATLRRAGPLATRRSRGRAHAQPAVGDKKGVGSALAADTAPARAPSQHQGGGLGVPRKVRELKAELRRAGFRGRPGKGSHERWTHPLRPGRLTLSGADRDDAKPYQERAVGRALAEVAAAQEGEKDL